MSPPNIVLHAGLGYSGTTSFQSGMSAWTPPSRLHLQYPPYFGTRKVVASLSPKGAPTGYAHLWLSVGSGSTLRRRLHDLQRWASDVKPRHVVLSDENLSGRIQTPERLSTIRKGLSSLGRLHLALMLNNPVVAVVTAYSNAVLYGYSQSFMVEEVLGWPALDGVLALDRLALLHPDSVHVRALDYERDFARQHAELVSMPSGLDIELPAVPRLNSSLSLFQVQTLLSLHRHSGGSCSDPARVMAALALASKEEDSSGAAPLMISDQEAIVVARAFASRSSWLAKRFRLHAPYLESVSGAVHHAIYRGKVGDGKPLHRLTTALPRLAVRTAQRASKLSQEQLSSEFLLGLDKHPLPSRQLEN